MSAQGVQDWLSSLRQIDPTQFDTGLSPQGAHAAWSASLDALDAKSVQRALKVPTHPPKTACFVAARTVFTAPIEWLAMWLGRGVAVTLKHPKASLGAAGVLAQTAQEVGLPLQLSSEHDAIDGAEVVLAMGSDATLEAIRGQLAPHQRLIALGHAFSAAWVDEQTLPTDLLVPEGFRDPWGSVAADAALYDGRGCLSPQVVYTALPVDRAIPLLADAMSRAQATWPRGRVTDAEHAQIRARRSLSAVLGSVHTDPNWEIHQLPAGQFKPAALPRCVALVCVQTHQAELELRQWRRWLSTTAGLYVPGARTCRVGRMQRPPLHRKHNGVDVTTGGLP